MAEKKEVKEVKVYQLDLETGQTSLKNYENNSTVLQNDLFAVSASDSELTIQCKVERANSIKLYQNLSMGVFNDRNLKQESNHFRTQVGGFNIVGVRYSMPRRSEDVRVYTIWTTEKVSIITRSEAEFKTILKCIRKLTNTGIIPQSFDFLTEDFIPTLESVSSQIQKVIGTFRGVDVAMNEAREGILQVEAVPEERVLEVGGGQEIGFRVRNNDGNGNFWWNFNVDGDFNVGGDNDE